MCEACNTEEETNENNTGAISDRCECPTGMGSRFIQPCLLLLLHQKDSYGYELIENLSKLGASSDASVVYRNLRRMEKEELVKSEWDTKGPGPAKRYYKLTAEGEDLLNSWAATLKQNKETLENFLEVYQQRFKKEQ